MKHKNTTQNIFVNLFFLIVFLFSSTSISRSKDLCHDYMLLDGSEKLLFYGLDTTRNWWAMTAPFQDKIRLYINGSESKVYDKAWKPVFSPDGNRWAVFVNYNAFWDLLTSDSLISLNATAPGAIVYSANSEVMLYSYFKSGVETAVFNDRKLEIYNRTSRYFLDPTGNKLAFVLQQGDGKAVVSNGNQSTLYDDVNPLGFWQNGKFMYSAKTGNGWQMYRGNEPITDIYNIITEQEINSYGTVAAFIGQVISGKFRTVLISDEYYEPLIGKPFDNAYGLILHPELSLYAYSAVFNRVHYVLYNNTEYYAGDTPGNPSFTFDGEDMFFASCTNDCYFMINGRKYAIKQYIDPTYTYAMKPASQSIAFSTSSGMNVLFLSNGDMHAGMMVDKASNPRYNRFDDRYEALGVISDRLYLLTCTTN